MKLYKDEKIGWTCDREMGDEIREALKEGYIQKLKLAGRYDVKIVLDMDNMEISTQAVPSADNSWNPSRNNIIIHRYIADYTTAEDLARMSGEDVAGQIEDYMTEDESRDYRLATEEMEHDEKIRIIKQYYPEAYENWEEDAIAEIANADYDGYDEIIREWLISLDEMEEEEW